MQNQFRLPKDIPLNEFPTPDTFLEEARQLSTDAQKEGLILRVMGPIALHYYFPEYVNLYRQMERLGERVFTDIDFASYGKQRGKLVPFFERHGYGLEKRAAMIAGGTRLIFFSPKIPMIDVFFDKLDYNHPVDFKNRLEYHPYCVSLTDLLLQKLQIVQINDKDLKDAMLLFLAASLGESDKDSINTRYLIKIFSDDWGFYYTAINNLIKIKEATANVSALNNQQRQIIITQIDQLINLIEVSPKSGKWKTRAQTGTKKSWYKEVSDWV